MNQALLNQYNIAFAKTFSDGKFRYKAKGGGVGEYLSNIGLDVEEINEALDKVNFFINGSTGDPLLIQEMESHHFNSIWVDFDYQNAYISDEFGEADYIQVLPLNDFKEILLMWEEFIQT